MSDKSVDEIMGLAIEFANRIASGYGDERTKAREALRTAITALAAERDIALDAEYALYEERDALKARVVELEKAIDGALNSKVTGYGGPADHANNCHARFSCWPPADCTCFMKELRDCMVRTIPARE